MATKRRRILFNIIRIAICVLALWFVLRSVTWVDQVTLREGTVLRGTVRAEGDIFRWTSSDGAIVIGRNLSPEMIATNEDGTPKITYGLKTVWESSSKMILLLAVLIHLPISVLQGLRIQWLLTAQGITLNLWNCTKLSFAGNFLNFAAPLGSTAGDVFKAYFVTLHTHHKTEAVTTVALDRFIGLGTLLLVAALIASLSPPGTRLSGLRMYLLTMLGLGIALVLVYLSPWSCKLRLSPKWLAKLPGIEQLKRVDQAARLLARHKAILTSAVLITAILQAMAVGAYFTVAIALRMDAHLGNLPEYYAYFLTGAVVQALPGPPQGLGTVELAYLYFFADYGSPSQIVCMAFTARLVVLACSLPGLFVTLTGSYRPGEA